MRILLPHNFGMEDPWNFAIQYRRTIVERDTFRTGDIQVNYLPTNPSASLSTIRTPFLL